MKEKGWLDDVVDTAHLLNEFEGPGKDLFLCCEEKRKKSSPLLAALIKKLERNRGIKCTGSMRRKDWKEKKCELKLNWELTKGCPVSGVLEPSTNDVRGKKDGGTRGCWLFLFK